MATHHMAITKFHISECLQPVVSTKLQESKGHEREHMLWHHLLLGFVSACWRGEVGGGRRAGLAT